MQAPRLKKLWRFSAAAILAVALSAAQTEEEPAAPGLEIVRLDLLDRTGGYAIPSDSVFYPGETVYLAFNIRGYRVDEDNDYRMHVRYKVETLSPLGKSFSMAEGGEWSDELAPQDEGWEPLVQYSARIPQYGGSGTYKILLAVEDVLAQKTVKREVGVRVKGGDVPVSDELTIRNFEFALTEGGTPLERPAVKAGDSIWAAFYITGYDVTDDNSYDVESSMDVINSEGKTVYAFTPRGEKGSPLYPRLWLPASFRLDLEKNVPSGKYLVQLTVKDKVGEKSLVTEYTFDVR